LFVFSFFVPFFSFSVSFSPFFCLVQNCSSVLQNSSKPYMQDNVTPYSFIDRYQRFGGTYCRHLQCETTEGHKRQEQTS
jgi:hypothetical protein